jgi:hypothetical protein
MPSLTETHRQAQLVIRSATLRDLAKLWPAMDWANLTDTYPAWAAAVQALIARDRQRSAGLAAAYLRAFRFAEGIDGEATITLAATPPAEQVETSLRVTSLVSVKAAATAGVSRERAMANAFIRSAGAATRLVLDGGRETIRESLARDDRAQGWRRITSGRACGFCSMLAGRGAVYSAETVSFQSHDHCSCSPEPVYR